MNVDSPSEGYLFAMEAQTLSERIKERRNTVADRVKKSLEIINEKPNEKWVIWCNLNDEQDELERALKGNVFSVRGSLTSEEKEKRIFSWLDGEKPYFLSKCSVSGFGLNMQCAHNMIFVGLTDSFEQVYQAIRRCYRFGQKEIVNCHFVSAETEGAVLSNIKRKEKDADSMYEEMVKNMADINIRSLKGSLKRNKESYVSNGNVILPSFIKG